MQPGLRILQCAAMVVVLALTWAPSAVLAQSAATQFSEQLGAAERQAFEAWYVAQLAHDDAGRAYWRRVESLRNERRRKKRNQQPLVDADYVLTFPPKYNGPSLSKDLLERWRAFQAKDRPPAKEREELPGVDEYLMHAKRYYNFEPERIPETEYKRRYAIEALRHGLSKDQVVKVFALETGGNGTADMQAGIHPITKKGRPISSALGYAQLLAANSINVMAKHGPTFVNRLARMVNRERVPERRQQLSAKLASLRAMLKTAKSIPYQWSKQRALARTPRGMGLHPLNIDGLIGPWMQVTKLSDIKKLAESRGLKQLTGAELELMNLAGPGTGLEMMRKVGRDKPTTNFFSERAYYRNSIVRGQTSDGLIAALEKRMEQNLKNRGSQEFLAIFDEILAGRKAGTRSSDAR
jgi:hypothetical protein